MTGSTKLASLKQHIADGVARKQQEAVLFILRTATHWAWPLSREQLEEVTKYRTASLCARLNELEKLGLIRVCGEKVSHTSGKRVHTYSAVLATQSRVYPQGVSQPCPTSS
jgi:hypothetical protein